MGACDRSIVVQAVLRSRAVGQKRNIVTYRLSELHAISGGYGRLDLEEDFDSSCLSRLNELIDDMAFFFCGGISLRWLIPKPLVEFEIGFETGGCLYPDFLFPPQGSFKQSRQSFVGICRWFSMTPLISGTFSHYVGRDGNC